MAGMIGVIEEVKSETATMAAKTGSQTDSAGKREGNEPSALK